MACFSKAAEFSGVRFHQDKGTLNQTNKDPGIRFRLKGRITTIDQKVNILLQMAIGNVTAASENKSTFSIASDMLAINQHANRVFKGLLEVLLVKKDFSGILNTISLSKSFKWKVWENSDLVTRQLEGIGQTLAQALASGNIKNFSDLLQADPRYIERLLNRHPPFGNKLIETASKLPKFTLKVSQVTVLTARKNQSTISLNVVLGLENEQQVQTNNKRNLSCLFLAGSSTGMLYDYRKISLAQLFGRNTFMLDIANLTAGSKIICTIMSEDLLGLDVKQAFTPDILGKPSKKASISIYFNESQTHAANSDDDDFEDDAFWNHFVENNTSQLDNTSTPQLTVTGIDCNHACRDKKACKHDCCKTGLKTKPRRKAVSKVPPPSQPAGLAVMTSIAQEVEKGYLNDDGYLNDENIEISLEDLVDLVDFEELPALQKAYVTPRATPARQPASKSKASASRVPLASIQNSLSAPANNEHFGKSMDLSRFYNVDAPASPLVHATTDNQKDSIKPLQPSSSISVGTKRIREGLGRLEVMYVTKAPKVDNASRLQLPPIQPNAVPSPAFTHAVFSHPLNPFSKASSLIAKPQSAKPDSGDMAKIKGIFDDLF